MSPALSREEPLNLVTTAESDCPRGFKAIFKEQRDGNEHKEIEKKASKKASKPVSSGAAFERVIVPQKGTLSTQNDQICIN